MRRWLIVPAKPFHAAKSRLAAVLAAPARAALSANLLARTLQIAGDAALFEQIVVVSRDAEALALATVYSAVGLPERTAELNAALQQACTWVSAQGATHALLLPADLPYLTVADLQLLAAPQAGDHAEHSVVIAPSRDGGTNALLLGLPARFEFAFGAQSFWLHQRRALAVGCSVRVVETPALAFDLDSPADLAELMAGAPAGCWENLDAGQGAP